MNILILGSEGFIGSHLCNYFIKQAESVTGADLLEQANSNCYIYNKVSRLSPEWEDLFASQNFDVCINAAGSGNVPYSLSHPLIDFEANTLDVIRLLDALRKYQPNCKYLHISSAAVYGNPTSLPVIETDKLQPVSPYGFHKFMSEIICREYHQLFGIQTSIIRPFSVYGPGLRKQLFWDICKKINEAGDSGITLYGTGLESRDFIYIDDLMNLIRLIIEQSDFKNDIYNAASGIETSIHEITQIIKTKKKSISIAFSGESRKGDPLNWRADVTKIKALGWSPKTSMNAGIYNYLDWFEGR